MTKQDPDPIISQALESETARHGFFTRRGGVSTGLYGGLNVGLGSRDNRDHVFENRRRVAETLKVGPRDLVSPHQVHSADALVVDRPWGSDERPKVDGLVTDKPGIAIGVLTADCGPVLFHDAQNRVAGCCHAGWKGAVSGILENTVAAMEGLGAKRGNITAVLGPTISSGNYEVGPEFVDRLLDAKPANERWFTQSQNAGHAMFDLPGYILGRLAETGVQASWTGQCTYSGEAEFYSYRRTTHRGEPDYGRQISAITLV